MTARQRKVVEKSDYTCIPIESFVYPWRCDSISINYERVQNAAKSLRKTYEDAGIADLLRSTAESVGDGPESGGVQDSSGA
eukprot:1658334-Rhodomonas_salina.1